jgi:hypothetical protein
MDVEARAKRGREVDHRSLRDPSLANQRRGTTIGRCKRTKKTVVPLLTLEREVLLLDHDYRTLFPAANPASPAPTATGLLLELHGDEAYTGGGTLTIAEGDAAVFTDAGCTAPLACPATFDGRQLRAGQPLYVLGRQRGALRFELELDPANDGDTVVDEAASADATIVELAFEASHFMPGGGLLGRGERIVFGKWVGVPAVGAASLRSKVRLRQSRPADLGHLVVRSSAGRVALYRNETRTQGEQDQIGLALADQDQELWIEGSSAGAAIWLSLGLELADGTILEHGDLLKVLPVAQDAISVGFEWENTQLQLERQHDADAERRPEQFEGIVSKAIVFESASASMAIDTEVGDSWSYGEFVLGPAYGYAELEAQLGEVKRVVDAVSLHRLVFVRTPADIMSRRDGEYTKVWMPANHRVALSNVRATWGGTAQATFAVPLWMLSNFLARFGGAPGQRAKDEAERFARALSKDRQNHARRQAGDRLIGLVAACQYYVEVFDGCERINANDGPKTALNVMFRTDFHAMYGLLSSGVEKASFTAWCQQHPARRRRLLPNGYNSGDAIQREGPTVAAWLKSVVRPVRGDAGKDKMSPPPGFARHTGNHPIKYGMGKLGLDGQTHHVIAECRALFRGNQQSFDAFTQRTFEIAEEFMLSGPRTWQRASSSRLDDRGRGQVVQDGPWGPPAQGGRDSGRRGSRRAAEGQRAGTELSP